MEQVGQVPVNYEWGNSLTVDSSNQPRITYYDSREGALLYAARTEGVWDVQMLDDDGDVGRFSSLALDSLDNPRIVYLEVTGARRGATTGYVKFATRNSSGDGWNIERVARLDDVFIDFLGARKITSLVLDDNEMPVFTYSDQSVIKLAYFDGTEWSTETITTSDGVPFGELTSLAMDADGGLHLTYTEVDERQRPGIEGTVMYARGTPSP